MRARRHWDITLAVGLALAAAGCGRFADPGAKLDKIEAAQKACEAKAAGDPAALGACHEATIAAAGKLVGRSRDADFRALLTDLYPPLLAERGGDAAADRAVVSSAFAELAVRRAAILTNAASGKGTPGSIRPFTNWPDADAGKAFGERWIAIRRADCDAYGVKACVSRLDVAMRRAIRQVRPGKN